jgi:RecG-like helicase
LYTAGYTHLHFAVRSNSASAALNISFFKTEIYLHKKVREGKTERVNGKGKRKREKKREVKRFFVFAF